MAPASARTSARTSACARGRGVVSRASGSGRPVGAGVSRPGRAPALRPGPQDEEDEEDEEAEERASGSKVTRGGSSGGEAGSSSPRVIESPLSH